MARLSVYILTTSSEMESDTQKNQQNIEVESNEDTVKENSIDQDPLIDYQLARDGDRSPRREP